ncbi:MAG TPA: hypothetical protein VFK44_01805 [Bacillales bacterium]|nr:hypothetical protein [Bacillales bacterium]
MRGNVVFVAAVVLMLVLSGCSKSVDGSMAKSVDAVKQTDQSKDASAGVADRKESSESKQQEGKSDKVTESKPKTKEEKSRSEADDVTMYAPKENIVKHFAGKGNEFATYSSETSGKQEALLAIVDHSGADVLKVYRVTPEQITWIYEQGGFPGGDMPDLKALEAKSNKHEVLLKAPLKRNATFDGWTIVETGAKVALPYGTLPDVVIVQKKGANGDVTTRYWAKQLGIVKTVYEFKGDDGKTYTISSELEKVDSK